MGANWEPVQESYRKAMRHVAQSVAVLTAPSEDEKGIAITVSSFTSVSMKPPLIVVCVLNSLFSSKAISNSTGFVLNLLAEDQSSVSDRCAGRNVKKGEKMVGIKHLASERGPLIAGALAWVKCRKWRIYDGGDHMMLVGLIEGITLNDGLRPLVYYDQKYARLLPETIETSPAAKFNDSPV